MSLDPRMPFGDWVRTRLFDQRTVLVSGELDTDLATAAAAELMTLDGEGDDLVTLHLDCSGGSLEAAFTLIDVVDLIGVPVHVVAVGRVTGPAVGILAVADRRLALPHASFQLREPQSAYAGRPDDIAGWAAQYQRHVDHFVARLARACNRTEDEVAADLRAARHFDPEEARAYGLVDEIVTGQAEVRRLPGRGFGFKA
ncbi:MAG: ATP-dependent Clp protease proteolytic subunit [Acidimicrobiales bacterium]